MKRQPGQPKGLPRGRNGGRPALPAEVKRLKGTYRPARERARAAKLAPVATVEVQTFTSSVGEPPDDFDKQHADAWKAHAAMVEEAGTYRKAYAGAFRKLVQAFVMTEKLLQAIHDPNGTGGNVSAWRAAEAVYAIWSARFGLSASDSVRVPKFGRAATAHDGTTEPPAATPAKVASGFKPFLFQVK